MIRAVVYPQKSNGKWFVEIFHLLLPFFIGVAVVCVPVTAAFILTGAIGDLIFDVVSWPAQWYARVRSLPFPVPGNLYEFYSAAKIYFPIAIWIAGLAIIVFDYKCNPIKPVRVWTMLALCLLSAMFYLKGLVRVSPIHMGLSIVPALIVAASLLSNEIKSFVFRSLGFMLVLGLFGLAALGAGKKITQGVEWMTARPSPVFNAAATNGSCLPDADMTRLACFAADSQWHIDSVKYVKAHSKENEPIFVGLSRHDKIFVNDMLFYFLSDRPPATKWHHFDPGLQTTEAIQLEIIDELQRSRTRLVILRDEWGDVEEPNESAISGGVKLLDNFIRENYQLVKEFENIWIYHLRESSISVNKLSRMSKPVPPTNSESGVQ